MAHIELDARQEREFERLCTQQIRPAIEGYCASCKCAIPVGYLSYVVRFTVAQWGSIRVQKPAVMYCRRCGKGNQSLHHERVSYERRNTYVASTELTAKQVALKIMPFIVPDKARSVVKLCALAGIQALKIAEEVCEALVEAGKVGKTDSGKYYEEE